MAKTISKGDIKTIKCNACGDPITVPKWAANNQACEKCTKPSKQPAADEPTIDEPVEVLPIDKVRTAQQILGELGFVITNRGWHKVYYDGTAAIRIEPMFDKGTSVDQDYVLTGFTLTRQEIIPVTDQEMNGKLPEVSHNDIEVLMRGLQVKMPGVALTERHVDVVTCSRCGDDTPDWMQIANGQILCMRKCAPTKKPYKVS